MRRQNRYTNALGLTVLVLAMGACSLFDGGPPVADGCPGRGYPPWETSPYVLPYPVGTSYRVGLSSCSGSYHSEGLPDAFAIDFDMEIGTTVTASRPGVVIRVQEATFDYGGGAGNYLWVDHDDGTFAGYLHFTHQGIDVAVGDSVVAGTVLGRSGASGLAGYPHLHFVLVEGSTGFPYTSLPVTFRNTDENLRGPASGHRYEALPY